MINAIINLADSVLDRKRILSDGGKGGAAIQFPRICASAGTGRQARLRGVCLRRTGSSPVYAHQMMEPLYPMDAEVFVIFGRAAAHLTTYQKKKGAFP